MTKISMNLDNLSSYLLDNTLATADLRAAAALTCTRPPAEYRSGRRHF